MMEPEGSEGVWWLGAAFAEGREAFDSTIETKFVATSVQRRGWGLVKKDQRPDRERARAIKARQRAIGRELRRVYDGVAQEAVPDEFLDLLRKIDDRETESEGES